MANDGSVIIDIDGDSSGLKKELSGIGGTAKSALSSMGDMAKTAMAGVGTAITAVSTAVGGIAAAAVKTGMDFDSAMSQVAATMGEPVSAMGQLRDFALEMGSKTSFSATEAAEALNYMALAGYDADKSMGMLPNVLNLAAAGNIALASASDMVTDAQSALGLSMAETEQLVDKMAKTSSKSNTSIAQLGEAILTVGGTAKTLAGGTTELSTALGILADNGVKGSEGGTALRNVILSLAAPTDKASAAMKSLGLEVFDAQGNMRPLNETFGDLNRALSSMTQGEQTQVLNTIFNKVDLKSVNALLANTVTNLDGVSGALSKTGVNWDAYAKTVQERTGDLSITAQDMLTDVSGMLVSMNEAGYSAAQQQQFLQEEFGLTAQDAAAAVAAVGADELATAASRWDELSAQIDDAQGAAQKMADTQLDNLAGDVTLFKSALEGVQIQISDQLTPSLREFTQFGAKAMSDLGEAVGSGGLTGLVEALGDVLAQALVRIAQALPQFINMGVRVIQSLISGILQNKASLAESAIEIGTALITGIGSILGDLAMAGLSIIVALAEGITQQAPQLIPAAAAALAQFVEGLVLQTGNLLATGLELIAAIVEGIAQALPLLAEAIPGIILALTVGISTHGAEIALAGQGILNSLIQGLGEALPLLADAALSITQNLAQGISEALPQLAETAVSLVQSFCQWLSENLPLIVEMALQMVMTLAQGILDSLPSLVDAAVQLVATLVDTIWNTDWAQIGSDILQFIVDGIAAILGSLLDIAIQLVDTLIDTIGEVNWFQLGADVLNFIINGISSLLGSLLSLAIQLVSTVWDKIATTDWVSLGRKVLDFIINGILNLIPNLLSAAVSVVQTVWNKVTGTNWLQLGSDLLKKIISGIRNVFTSLGTVAKDLVNKIGNTIKNTDWLGVGRNIIQGIANGIGNAAGVLVQAARNVASNALGAIKSFFGIASPSKVMAKEVGRWLPPGIGKGMEQTMPQLNKDTTPRLQRQPAPRSFPPLPLTAQAIPAQRAGVRPPLPLMGAGPLLPHRMAAVAPPAEAAGQPLPALPRPWQTATRKQTCLMMAARGMPTITTASPVGCGWPTVTRIIKSSAPVPLSPPASIPTATTRTS